MAGIRAAGKAIAGLTIDSVSAHVDVLISLGREFAANPGIGTPKFEPSISANPCKGLQSVATIFKTWDETR